MPDDILGDKQGRFVAVPASVSRPVLVLAAGAAPIWLALDQTERAQKACMT